MNMNLGGQELNAVFSCSYIDYLSCDIVTRKLGLANIKFSFKFSGITQYFRIIMKTQSTIAFTVLTLFFLLISKVALSQDDTVFTFSKPNRAEVKMVVDGFYYIDAEDFDHYGGWKMDNQFVH